MIKKVLVANRGEVAVRIIRALRELNITSVAVYSEADADSLHKELADEAICIGPAKSLDSYANPVAIISAALVTQADAIHPGYGFLSEKSEFVNLCESLDIKFIGPSSETIELMGHKQQARETMMKAGIPVTPGSEGIIESLEEAQKIGEQIGYPIMLKAADGGGGKGMRLVPEPSILPKLFQESQRETQAIYGNQDIYIEKIISPAKHIEVQLLGDQFGNVIHLGERDCSVQRHHQKVLEMAPAPGLSESVRSNLLKTAVEAARAIGYENAGTIEFLLDENENFYFMEMNTRLQVEHPISEMITGVDIVKEQIRIADGRSLSIEQADVQFEGFALEVRLNAEDPMNDFRPAAGYINRLLLPSGGIGLRVESAIYSNYLLPPYYDSMVAKIITWGQDMDEAFALMRRALYEVEVEGIITNVNLLDSLVSSDQDWRHIHTKWLEEEYMSTWLKEESEQMN